MTKKIPGTESGLAGYWNLDEVSGELANDLSTDSRNGKVFGETWTATTLTDTARSWTLNQWAGHKVRIINNTGYGQVRDIVSNTATRLTVSPAWTTNPALNSKYAITVFDRFTCSDAPIGDANVYDYNITSLDTLTFTDGSQLFSAQDITGTVLPKAVHIYRVNQPPNFTTSPSSAIQNFDAAPYYWGVHVIGGTAPSYTVQYTYTA